MNNNTMLDLARRISSDGITGFVIVDLSLAGPDSLIPHLPHEATTLVLSEPTAIEFKAGEAPFAYADIVGACLHSRQNLRGRIMLAEAGRTETTTFE